MPKGLLLLAAAVKQVAMIGAGLRLSYAVARFLGCRHQSYFALTLRFSLAFA